MRLGTLLVLIGTILCGAVLLLRQTARYAGESGAVLAVGAGLIGLGCCWGRPRWTGSSSSER
jgi:tellurite resistance protein TehA-like permease